jgi:hypothetical protein
MSTCLHLRIKEAGSCFNNANSLVESLNLVNCTVGVGNNGDQLETEILWVEVDLESKRKSELLAGRDLSLISCSRQISNNARTGMGSSCQWLQSRQCASNNGYSYWLLFFIDEIQKCFCRVTVNELHTEDFGAGDWMTREDSRALLRPGAMTIRSFRGRILRFGQGLTASAAKTLTARRARRARAVYL